MPPQPVPANQTSAKLTLAALTDDQSALVLTYEATITQVQLNRQLANLQNQQANITNQIADIQTKLALFPAKAG